METFVQLVLPTNLTITALKSKARPRHESPGPTKARPVPGPRLSQPEPGSRRDGGRHHGPRPLAVLAPSASRRTAQLPTYSDVTW